MWRRGGQLWRAGCIDLNVFRQVTAVKVRPAKLRTTWTKVRDKAKVVGRWHDNRHTLVTELAESGGKPVTGWGRNAMVTEDWAAA